MTGPGPARPPPVFGLHVRFGDRWTQPTADYACRCGWTAAAAGEAAVARFVATIHRTHATRCPIKKEPQ